MRTNIRSLIIHHKYIDAIDELIWAYRSKISWDGKCPLCVVAEAITVEKSRICGYCLWPIFTGVNCCVWLNEQPGTSLSVCGWDTVHGNPLEYERILEKRLEMLREWHQAMVTGEMILEVKESEERHED